MLKLSVGCFSLAFRYTWLDHTYFIGELSTIKTKIIYVFCIECVYNTLCSEKGKT